MKVIAIIQARVGSSRLPGKVLMKIKKKSVLENIVNFLKTSKEIDQIIIATTELEEDTKIEQEAKKIGISCFRGETNDVLKRYYDCAKKFKGDIIVRYSGDNLLVNPELIDEGIKISKEESLDYVSSVLEEGYPYGYSSCEILSFKILKELHETQKSDLSREHVTYDIRQNPEKYTIKSITVPKELRRNWKLALDEIEDFRRLEEIFEKMDSEKDITEYQMFVQFIEKNFKNKIPEKK